MKFKIRHAIGIFIALFLVVFAVYVLLPTESRWFKPLLGVAFFVAISQFWFDVIQESKRNRELEEKFLEFVRSISDNVKSGIPIPKVISEIGNANYGALSPYVRKLMYQIEWGVPLREAFARFADETGNNLIKRSMAIVIEAEQSGGHIEKVLESVTASVLQIKKIKEERRTNIFSQIIQGYFIFIMFIAIMIVLQLFLLPQLVDISGSVLSGVSGGFTGGVSSTTIYPSAVDFNIIFIFLILIQGFFTGIMVGKFSEGNLKYGLKHSVILMLMGYLAFTVAAGF
jgi:archaeal flagellar protein FlaJ